MDKGFRIKGWHVLAGLVGFFGVVIAVNFVFIFYATRSFPGQTVERPYERGIRYNDTLSARQRAIDEGWSSSVALENDTWVVVHIANQHGPVDGLDVGVVLRWAGQPDRDKIFQFNSIGNGNYRAAIDKKPFPNNALTFTGVAKRANDDWVFEFAGKL